LLNVAGIVTGALIDAAIYNVVAGYPGTKLADLITSLDCSSTGQKTIDCDLSQGWYNVALIARTAAPNFTVHSATSSDNSFLPVSVSTNVNATTFMRITSTTFPSTITSTSISYNTLCPIIWVKTK
jgi:hypothetical protein